MHRYLAASCCPLADHLYEALAPRTRSMTVPMLRCVQMAQCLLQRELWWSPAPNPGVLCAADPCAPEGSRARATASSSGHTTTCSPTSTEHQMRQRARAHQDRHAHPQQREEHTACGGSLLRRRSCTEHAVAAPLRSSHARVSM